MVDDFDPYLGWLDIGRQQRPVEPHRLLALPAAETDPQVIAAAAERVVRHLQQFAAGEHAELCRRVIDEVFAARDALSNAPATPRRAAPATDSPRGPAGRNQPPAVPHPSAAARQKIAPPPPVPGRVPPAVPAAADAAADVLNSNAEAVVIPVGSLLATPPEPPAAAAEDLSVSGIHRRPRGALGEATFGDGTSGEPVADYEAIPRHATRAVRMRRKSRRQSKWLWSLILASALAAIAAAVLTATKYLHGH